MTVTPTATDSQISTRRECYVLRLPSQILLHITHLLVQRTSLTVIVREDYSALIPWSSSHRYLRQICIMAGLFTHLVSAKMLYEDFEKFKESIDFHRISSLAVDIGNKDVWSICAHIMRMQPDLRELCIMGKQTFHTLQFRWLGLAKQFAKFRGMSVVFRNATFDRTSVHVLACIGGQQTVNSLTFERSILSFDHIPEVVPYPLFPPLKSIKYIRGSFGTPQGHTGYIFPTLFMTNCPLTHFEMSFALQKGDNLKIDGTADFTRTSNRSGMEWICKALRTYSLASLQVFLDRSSCNGTFIDLEKHSYMCLTRRRPSFQQMKTVIIELVSIQELLDETPCHQDQTLWPTRQIHSSVWRYLSLRYASFPGCDCLIVHIGRYKCTDTEYSSLWELATERLLNCSYQCLRKLGDFRYFIVGNSTHGYRGIERNMRL